MRLARIVTHPGEVIRDEYLKPLNMSASDLANALRVPATKLRRILKCESQVNAEMAMRLGRYFGTTADYWLNLQNMDELSKAYLEQGKQIERDVRPRAALGGENG